MSGFTREETDEVKRGAKAVIALPELSAGLRDTAARLEEASGLAAAIGLDVVDRLSFRLRQPKPATLFGSGQVEQIATAARMHDAEAGRGRCAAHPRSSSRISKKPAPPR